MVVGETVWRRPFEVRGRRLYRQSIFKAAHRFPVVVQDHSREIDIRGLCALGGFQYQSISYDLERRCQHRTALGNVKKVERRCDRQRAYWILRPQGSAQFFDWTLGAGRRLRVLWLRG